MGWGEKGGEKKEEKKKRFRERSSTFSLIFSVIGPAVYDRVRGKVHPRGKRFTLRLESRSFDKTPRGRGFLLFDLVFG